MRAPALFLPHGGGPLPLLGDPSHAPLTRFLSTQVPKMLNQPKAIVLVTAHWETSNPTISSADRHNLYFDYYGFPAESYKYTYPAPGRPGVARQVFDLLKQSGFSPQMDEKRGWDHGTFVPMKLVAPEAQIPIVQLSVLSSQDPALHIKMGQALEPLRDEGVAIIGSGMSFHNMQLFFAGPRSGGKVYGEEFDTALTEACTSDSREQREKKLVDWANMPRARESHPVRRAEHLMPLLVVAGAGGNDKGKKIFESDMMNSRISGFLW